MTGGRPGLADPPLADWARLRARCLLAETDDWLVLDKPAGVSVTGERHETDLVRMAKAAGESLIPVHRIDKVTSGVVLLARTPAAHGPLTRQFARRTVTKGYLALTRVPGLPATGVVDLPLCTGRKNRVRVAAPREHIRRADRPDGAHWDVPPDSVRPDGLPSLSRFRRLWEGRGHTLLAVAPTTGRRHQIRVHLAWIGHPIAGDPLFPPARPAGEECAQEPAEALARTGLHARRLSFDDASGRRISVAAEPDERFWAPVAAALPPAARAALLADV